MTEHKFYVYQYVREDGSPYYIGKGSSYRISEKKHSVIVPKKKYRQFVGKYLTEEDAFKLEGWLTHKYGLLIDGTGILENKIHGGGNVSPEGFTGNHHSDYSKEKTSNGNKGKVRTELHKINYRKPKTADHIEKIRQANLGRKDSEERKNKMAITKSKQRWYTNGKVTKMCEPGKEPSTFIAGRRIYDLA